MPVPTSIDQLSTTAASNSPSGSDSPSVLDDHLRTQAAFIAQLRDKASGERNVISYGAKGDGVTDDTSAIQSAINAGGVVHLGPGTFSVTGLTMKSGVQLVGAGSTNTKIKLAASSNRDLIVGQNAYSLFGTNTYDGIMWWSIQGMTLDANMAQQSPVNPDACNGLAYYGAAYLLRDVVIANAKGHGIRSEYYAYGETDGGMEAVIDNVRIDRCGRHGWWAKGPHDHHVIHMIVIDASQEADNTYCGCYGDGYFNGRFFNFHAWHRNPTTNRQKFAMSSPGVCEFIACHFEGGRAQLEHRGQGDRVVSCNIYAHKGSAGTALVVMGGSDNEHTDCYYQGEGADRYAIEIRGSSNRISGKFIGFGTRTPFNFAVDTGYNVIIGSGWAASGGATTFGGTQHSTTRVTYRQGGTAIDVTQIGSLSSVEVTGQASLGGAAGSESLRVNNTPSGVNRLECYAGTTGNAARLYAAGETNVGLQLSAKGSSALDLCTGNFNAVAMRALHVQDAVNRLESYGGTTGGSPRLYAAGSDTNIGLQLSAKGTGNVDICTGIFSAVQVRIPHVASAVNYVQLSGGAAGASVKVQARGSDTNVDLELQPQGSGVIKLGAKLNANSYGLDSVQYVAGPGWTLTAASSGVLAIGSSFVVVNEAAPVNVTDMTQATGASGIPMVTIRNSGTSAVTFKHDTTKLRNISGADVVLGQHQSITYVHISGAVWQQTGGKG